MSQQPIPMVLHCPSCGTQHIDAPEPENGWSNPPHRTHLCQFCQGKWRPALVQTTGVRELPKEPGGLAPPSCPSCHSALYYEAAEAGHCSDCPAPLPPIPHGIDVERLQELIRQTSGIRNCKVAVDRAIETVERYGLEESPEAKNQATLAKAQIGALGSQLLDVQKDCAKLQGNLEAVRISRDNWRKWTEAIESSVASSLKQANLSRQHALVEAQEVVGNSESIGSALGRLRDMILACQPAKP